MDDRRSAGPARSVAPGSRRRGLLDGLVSAGALNGCRRLGGTGG